MHQKTAIPMATCRGIATFANAKTFKKAILT